MSYREMNTKNFLNHLELLYEERLVEKTSLNIKIIEVNIILLSSNSQKIFYSSGCVRNLWSTNCSKCCAFALKNFDSN